MTQLMLDTNICIYIIKQKPKIVIEQFRKYDIANILISSVTLSELQYGAMKSLKTRQNQAALSQFTTPLTILPYDDAAAYHYGGLRAYLERQGAPIGSLDMLIAAHALATGCTLVTNNEKEFRRVPYLKIENWVSG